MEPSDIQCDRLRLPPNPPWRPVLLVHRVKTWSTGSKPGPQGPAIATVLSNQPLSAVYSGSPSRPGFVSFHPPDTPLRTGWRGECAFSGMMYSGKLTATALHGSP